MKFNPSKFAAAAAALLLGCGLSAVQAQTTLTMSSWVGPTHARRARRLGRRR